MRHTKTNLQIQAASKTKHIIFKSTWTSNTICLMKKITNAYCVYTNSICQTHTKSVHTQLQSVSKDHDMLYFQG